MTRSRAPRYARFVWRPSLNNIDPDPVLVSEGYDAAKATVQDTARPADYMLHDPLAQGAIVVDVDFMLAAVTVSLLERAYTTPSHAIFKNDDIAHS